MRPYPLLRSYRDIMRIAWPLMLTSASYTLMQFTDRLMLSWHSDVSVAAAGAAGLLNYTIAAVFIGIVSYAGTLVAQYYGAQQPQQCGRSAWQGIWLALGSYPLFLLTLPLGLMLLQHSGHDAPVIAAEQSYYLVLGFGTLFLLLQNTVSSFFSGLGHTRIVLAGYLAANLINIPLNYCLIFGKFGLPELGIAGAGLGTVIANAVITLVYAWRFLLPHYAAQFGTRAQWRFDRVLAAKLFRYGFPAGLQHVLDLSSFTVFVFLLGMNGTTEQMAGNILLTVNSLLFLPMLGLGTATATLVGQNLGARRRAAAARYTYRALHLGWLYQACGALVLLAFPDAILGLFRGPETDPAQFAAVLDFGRQVIIIIVLYNVFDAASVVITGALRGAGDTLFPMACGAIIAWGCFVPLTYTVIAVLGHSIVWAFACLGVYVVILMLVLWLRFRSGAWRHRVLV